MNNAKNALLGFQFRKGANLAKPFGAGRISFRALEFFFEFRKIDIARDRRRSFFNSVGVAIRNQQRRIDIDRIDVLAWFLREQNCRSEADEKRSEEHTSEL